MSNPFLSRADRKAKQSKSYWRAPRQEKEMAKRIGGHRVSGSGSGKRKGDVRLAGICRIEVKSTQAQSFRVTREMLAKIGNAAVGNDEVSAVVVEFCGKDGKVESRCAVVPLDELERLIRDAKAQSA